MEVPSQGVERRRAPRVPMLPGGPVSVVGAKIVNVSEFGMMIESPVPMERELVLRFRLVVSGEKADVEARVAGCSRRPRRRFGVGLEFTKIGDDLRRRLVEALHPPGTYLVDPGPIRDA